TAKALWAKNPSIDLTKLDLDDRVIFVKPNGAWPVGSELHVTLGKGAPSKEGPRVSTKESATSFEVVEAFRVKGITCDDNDKVIAQGALCPARGGIAVTFSNPIEIKTYRAEKV